MNKKYIVSLVVIGIIAIGGYFFPQIQAGLGATANRLPHGYWDTADGYYVDGTAIISGGGLVTTGSITLDSKDTINEFDCVSNTAFNPALVSATTTITATTSVPGAALGDHAFSTLATSSQGIDVFAYVSEADVITTVLSDPDADDGAGVNFATTTLKACYIGF